MAYAAIAALQLRVIWGIWKYADLTNGDTSYYFVDATSWAHGLHENIVYYPLYDAFWGTILAVVHDVYAATIIHRVAIVLAVTLLILALMRSLFGPALGLLIAAWWAIVPANYDMLYEIHLFGVLPILLVVLVVAHMPRREGLGIAIAILLAGAVLVRNELIAAALILGVAVVVYEGNQLRKGERSPRSAYIRAYLLPLTLACLLIGGAYARSHIQGEAAWRRLGSKEEENFCESYAVSYQQRHRALFTGNPFTECSVVMQQTFGRPMPSLFQGIAANPRAVAGFAAWGAQLLPGGLQVGLLGATALENDPGFTPVTENSTYALLLSVALLIVVIAGLAVAAREGELSVRRMSTRTRWIIVTLASIAAADVLVVLTVRPWAEYIYGLSICALMLIGASVSVLVRRVGGTRILAPVALGAVVALIVTQSSIYGPGPRPLYEAYEHLRVVQRRLQAPGGALVSQASPNVLCNYLAYSYERVCMPIFWPVLRSQVTGQTTVGQVLDRNHVTVLYVESEMLGDPEIAKLVAAPQAQGWRQIAGGNGLSGPWRVLIPADRQT
jgi:hypothetical protein